MHVCIFTFLFIVCWGTMNLERHFEGLRITPFQIVYSNRSGRDSRETWSDGKSTVYNTQGQQINPCLCSLLAALLLPYSEPRMGRRSGKLEKKAHRGGDGRGGRSAEREQNSGVISLDWGQTAATGRGIWGAKFLLITSILVYLIVHESGEWNAEWLLHYWNCQRDKKQLKIYKGCKWIV